jgi:general secretion pathway protein N
MRSQHITTALLAVLCVALGGFAIAELTGSDANTREASAPGTPPSSASQVDGSSAGFSLPALRSFATVSDHPLFSPDRRPARSADNSGAWSSFTLAGIIITSQSREALVAHGKPPTIAHVVEGQTIDGWTVSAIYPDHVVFTDPLTEHELRLIDKTVASPPASTAPPAQRRPPF